MEHDIWKSRRFWVALVGLAVMLLVNYVPALEDQAEEVTGLVLAVVGMLVGGFTLEDVAVGFKAGERNPKYKK